MKFEIQRASDPFDAKGAPCRGAVKTGADWFVEINTLEELLAPCDEVDTQLIVNRGDIWIYDDYME